MPDARPNLLIVMTDHQRADSLGMVQSGVEVCPNLTRLAARSWRAERCYNMAPLCVPARTALATGRYPAANGVVCNEMLTTTHSHHPTWHRHLAEAGYTLAHVGVDHVRTAPPVREQAEYDLWISNAEHRNFLADQGIEPNPPGWPELYKLTVPENCGGERLDRVYSNTAVGPWDGPAEAFLDRWWAKRAAGWLHSRGGLDDAGPFAMFLNLWAPHPPLVLPEPYFSMFEPDGIDLPPNVGKPNPDEPPDRRDAPAARLAEGLTGTDWRRVWAAHLGLVRLADDAVGQALAAIDEAGLAGSTVIAFTSDHGDHLGQHGLYQKMEMYEPAVRVPLLLAGPGIAPGRCGSVVSHLDLHATVLDLAGLPEAAAASHGRSLVPALHHGRPPRPDRPAFIQYTGNPAPGDLRRAVVTDRFKYVWSPAGSELFDLCDDPLETRNLAADPAHRGTLDGLHTALLRHAAHVGDGAPSAG